MFHSISFIVHFGLGGEVVNLFFSQFRQIAVFNEVIRHENESIALGKSLGHVSTGKHFEQFVDHSFEDRFVFQESLEHVAGFSLRAGGVGGSWV